MANRAALEIDLNPELHAALLAAAEAAHRPAADIITDLVREYVEGRREDTAYDEFVRRKVEKARASLRAGKGRSSEEVEAMFAALREGLSDNHR